MPKFIELCMSENRKLQKNLSMLVEKAFKFEHKCYHTGPSFNTGTENTIQVSKFKRIGFENNGGFRWGRIGL